MPYMITRIISGGQTGVDRGALDAAIALGIPHGGWCPRGRRAEDGRIPDVYQLSEARTSDYLLRTRLNVMESSGTLILSPTARLTGGTMRTEDFCIEHRVTYWIVALDAARDAMAGVLEIGVREWLNTLQALHGGDVILNVAGPRESKAPGIQVAARDFLMRVLRP